MDQVIYGMIYPMAKLPTTFVAIDFANPDIVCYNLNDYGTIAGNFPTRQAVGDLDAYGGGY